VLSYAFDDYRTGALTPTGSATALGNGNLMYTVSRGSERKVLFGQDGFTGRLRSSRICTHWAIFSWLNTLLDIAWSFVEKDQVCMCVCQVSRWVRRTLTLQ
jgi:hypothetical protein